MHFYAKCATLCQAQMFREALFSQRCVLIAKYAQNGLAKKHHINALINLYAKRSELQKAQALRDMHAY